MISEEYFQNPFISCEADSDDGDEYDSEYPTGDQDDIVPLISRSESSRLDSLLDNIQNCSQTKPNPIIEVDNTQALQWLEENYDASIEVPGYEIFSLRCKVSLESFLSPSH